ncbi:hypothetical protein HZC21_05935 [Candidatus Peregrinibacteria bacterium]|nr:hypothetical protein [Candidatus Peregrinibacteria bacterium]
MERLRTADAQRNLTAELNRLLRTNQVALRNRIIELLQSTDPAIIMQFEAAERDPKLNLSIISVISDCRNELAARVLLSHNQGPTRQGIQNLMNAAEALHIADQNLFGDESPRFISDKSAAPNELALELYRLLDQKGTEGVRQKIGEIFSRPGADMRNFRESNALAAAERHFRGEAEKDPSSKAAAILKIIETF